MSWQELQQRFLEVVRRAEGPMKSSCGTISVYYGSPYAFDCTGVEVTLGGYCIGNWSRHETIGPFRTEAEALVATATKIEEARQIVEAELLED